MSPNNLTQAQQTYDNQLPPDTTEQDELIESMAKELSLYGNVPNFEGGSLIYLDDLEPWLDDATYKSILVQSKIYEYKLLQVELCSAMLTEIK